MSSSILQLNRKPLLTQLRWFVSLRWLAGAGVLVGALIEWFGLQWFDRGPVLLGVGVAILSYNLVLWLMLRRPPGQQEFSLLSLSWVQILLDLACLTLLTLLTGGLRSPLLHFFYLHMVFAATLLPRFMAFGAASVAMLLFSSGLWLGNQWPTPEQKPEKLIFIGWLMMLLLVVHLTSRISRALRRQRRRLLQQNQRISSMSRRLKRHQRAAIQHEKMVALGQMAAGVAHEIANPLASMDSLLQLMQRKPERLTPERLGTLREQVTRIHQILQQMTSFAHPSDGEWRMANLNEVVGQAVRMVQMDPRLKKTAVVEDFAPEVGEIKLMPHALHQVLINLMMNAGDAMEQTPEPKLVVRTRRNGEWVVIEVIDNGQGIRPEHRARLFEPFFTTKPVGKGTGLGLSISYNLVRSQGGRLEVKSEVGRGATFAVHLPVGERASRNREGAAEGLAVSENHSA